MEEENANYYLIIVSFIFDILNDVGYI